MKNFQENTISKLIIKSWYVLLFFIIIMAKCIICINLLSQNASNYKALYSIFASVLLIISISLLFKRNAQINYLYFMDLLISIFIVTDLEYFRYFNDVVSISSLKNLTQLVGVSQSVKSIFSAKYLLFFIDIPLLLPVISHFEKRPDSSPYVFFKRAVLFAVFFTISFCMEYRIICNFSKEQPGLLSSLRNKLYITNNIGSLNYHGIDIYNFISVEIKKSVKLPEERKQLIKNVLATNNSADNSTVNYSNIGNGKNLIVIQVESLQQFVINTKVNGQEVTPNLNKFINKSLYFDNFFHQVAAGNTSDAEFMTNNSLYPAAAGAAYSIYYKNDLNSIAEKLKEKKYYTAAFHANNATFWNRNVMYETEGFDDFYSLSNYNNDEIISLGLSDKSFLDQTLKKLKTLKEPYYSFIVTLTSHYPFDATDSYGQFDTGEYENTLLGNYLKAIHYTDQQLGTFLDGLEKSGIMDNSIIAIYGDHSAIPKNNISDLYKLMNEKNNDDFHWYQYQKVPFIIHFPGDKYSGINHIYTGQMDTYPTLANILGINPNYILGKDMLNSKEGKVIFRNGSFTDGNIFYISSTDSYYDMKTGKVIKPTEEMIKKKNDYSDELQYSDDILNKNLIKEFKN